MNDKSEIAAVMVIVVGIGLIAGLVINENRTPVGESQVLGQKFTQSDLPAPIETGGIPTLPVTIPPVIPPTPSSIPTTAAPSATAAPAASSTGVARPVSSSGVAVFDLTHGCAGESVNQNGTKVGNGARQSRARLAAGQTFSYTFTYDAETQKSTTQRCTLETTKVSGSSASPLRIMLRCNGESTYASTPPSPPTSSISRTFRPEQLTDGFTHEMNAPRQSQQTERTTCTVDVVRV